PAGSCPSPGGLWLCPSDPGGTLTLRAMLNIPLTGVVEKVVGGQGVVVGGLPTTNPPNGLSGLVWGGRRHPCPPPILPGAFSSPPRWRGRARRRRATGGSLAAPRLFSYRA